MSVIIETTIGDLIIDLYTDERKNSDPSGTGNGGESAYGLAYGDQAKYFDWEVIPKIKHKKLGAVSMINNGSNQHGSQFLITLDVSLDYLDGKHTVFGEIAKGFDVLQKFNDCITDKSGRPYQDIRITHTIIIDDPFEDIRALEYPPLSPVPTDERLESEYIRCDEDINILEGKTEEEVRVILEEREMAKRAKVLEIIGDIPDADIKPPENVLFVCKLNQVTSDADLELIFSRFGPIKSCEVIRDRKTGESLCYAFIEFEREEDCENAFFKMDNVLIDDRRIHVDFSQSVSRLVWKGKGTNTGYFQDEKEARKFQSNEYHVRDKSRRGEGYSLVFDENDTHHRDTHKRRHNYDERDRDRYKRRNDDRNEKRSRNHRDGSRESERRRHENRHKSSRH